MNSAVKTILNKTLYVSVGRSVNPETVDIDVGGLPAHRRRLKDFELDKLLKDCAASEHWLGLEENHYINSWLMVQSAQAGE
jgi:hypothetical protein